MKHTIKMSVALLTSLILLGCGGGGGSSSSGGTTPTPTPSSVTVKAIDGYLVDAEVWVDANDNLIVDDGDRYIGLTNESGELEIPEGDLAHAIIVKAIAGQTYDQDTGGRLSRTYEMVSVEGNNHITPFSTIARVNGTTLDVVAADLGYDAELLADDYVAVDSHEAEKTHLLARSTVELLGGDLTETKAEASTITTKVNALPASIDLLVNNGEDLDTKVIKADGTTETKLPPLTTYLGDTVMYQFSTNETRYDREGYSSLEFKEERMNYNNIMMARSFSTDVVVANNSYTRSIDNRNDSFIYLSDQFGLTVSSAGTLDFTTTDTTIVNTRTGAIEFNYIPASHYWFNGKTVYWLIDDSEESEKATPIIITFEFTTDAIGVMRSKGEADQPFVWHVTHNGELHIDRDNGDKDLVFQPAIENDDMVVALMKHNDNKYSRIPMFLIKEEDLAYNLYDEWVK
tara:strand:- start:533 stop:1906 length:1374 start_codon:yes stop_codon:yes gene_type:complete